jgi:Ca2+-binding RTX toxin-like protein
MPRMVLAAVVAALALAVAPVANASHGDVPTVDIVGGVGIEGGNIPFTVALSSTSDVPVTVDFITGDGTAERRLDYTGRRGTVTVPAGQRSTPLEFPAILDRILETDERFRVELSNPVNAHFGDNIDSATIVNTLRSGRCANLLRGRDRVDILTGSDAGDRIDGRSDQDFIAGLGGDDCLFGHAGADQLRGAEGDDTIDGGTGNDRLNGGPGDDTLIGGRGRNRYVAEDGDDSIFARNGIREKIDCGPGMDRAKVDNRDRVRNCEIVSRGVR